MNTRIRIIIKIIKFVAVGSDEALSISKTDLVPSDAVMQFLSENPSFSKKMEDNGIMCAHIKYDCQMGVMYDLYQFMYYHSDGSWKQTVHMIATQMCLDSLKEDSAVWAVYSDEGAA